MENRAAINQENSKHSTGPKTPEGKKISSQNALRHGLTAQTALLPTEDPAAYEQHLQAFLDEFQPQTALELHLTTTLVETSWRLRRVATLEVKVLSAESLETQLKGLAILSTHGQRLSRQFERTAADLRALQKTRIAQEDAALREYLDIRQMYEEKEEDWDPVADGFVFSDSQIDRATQARNRERLVDEAAEYAD
jgi:hypothetical protein